MWNDSVPRKAASAQPEGQDQRYIATLVPPQTSESFEHSLIRLGPNLKTVFDVGANVGDMTIAMCKRFPDATVYAFEPYSKTFEVLRARV